MLLFRTIFLKTRPLTRSYPILDLLDLRSLFRLVRYCIPVIEVLRELNRPREAEPLLREALEGLDELKGKQHPDASGTENI